MLKKRLLSWRGGWARGLIAWLVILGANATFIQDVSAQTLVLFRNPKKGAPRTTGSGASRGDNLCNSAYPNAALKFMSLVPVDSNYGLTTQERPMFMVHIPPTSAKKVFFNLRDEEGQVHYQAQLPIKGKGELLMVTLPETVAALEVGKSYEWGVAILCNGKLRPDSPSIHSWIERTNLSPTLVKQTQETSLLAQAQLYGENGIWYDMLEKLVKLRQADPSDPALQETWKVLLASVGLETLSD